MQLPFRRKQDATKEVPAEIEQYYSSEQRERTSATWLMGAGVFIVTVVVVLGLFYGGRALYRAVVDNDTPITQEQTGEQGTSEPADNTQNNGQAQSGDEELPATDSNDANDTTETETPTQTPRTGPSEPEQIPQTGPSVDL